MKSITIIAICAICAATLMSGCLESVSEDDEYEENVLVNECEETASVCGWDDCQVAPPIINHNLNRMTELDNQVIGLFDDYAPAQQYTIWTKTGSEVYVCSHYGCDMAENLINAGYNAGVCIDHNENHALTWCEIDNQIYVIEPQTRGEYWSVEDYDMGRNIDVVSLQKGREHAKQSSEALHR